MKSNLCEKYKNHPCVESDDNRKILVVKEKRSEYRMVNKRKKRLVSIKLDGCLVANSTACDYWILVCDDKRAYFVELKGNDRHKALLQIDASLERYKKDLKDSKFTPYGRISLTKTPNIISNTEKRLMKKFKQLGGTFRRQNSPFTENI